MQTEEDLITMANRELRGHANEEEKAFLASDVEQWNRALGLLEASALTEIGKHRATLKQQQQDIEQTESSLEEKQAALRELWQREKWRRDKISLHQTRLQNIRRRRASLHSQVEASRQKRHPPTSTVPSTYATAYRRGFIRGIGAMYSLLHRSMPADQAFELCKNYAHTELQTWCDTYEPGNVSPPPFLIEEDNQE